MATLTFHGAAREVTGSMHLLEADGKRIALDCGLFQGRRAESAGKNQHFPVDPRSMHAVVLSHAHIDHTGRLPLLCRSGFEGSIHATPATRDLCAVMLADSAHIQEEDAEFLNRKLARKGEPPISPLYSEADVRTAMEAFRTVSYNHWFWVSQCVRARYFEAGHMLGSAGIELEITEPGRPPVRLVFSGDLGRFGQPIIRDPAPLPACDFLICESTYGNRVTSPVADLPKQLETVIRETFARGGKVIVPAFSVGRTQTVVYAIHTLIAEGRLKTVPVFVDSPLSVNASEVFQMHPECFDADAKRLQARDGGLGAGFVTYVHSVTESMALDRRKAPCVIISASGMCETGRILHHLKNHVASPKHTVLIVGFQAEHTLGRRIVEKQRKLRIFHKEVPLRAQVTVLNGFSSHADRDELRRMTRPLAAGCRRAFLVHGELDQMTPFAGAMRDMGFRGVEIPEPGQAFELNGAAQ